MLEIDAIRQSTYVRINLSDKFQTLSKWQLGFYEQN